MPEPDTFPAPMTVSAEQLDDQIRVIAAGEIDMSTAADLRIALNAAMDRRPPKLLIDLAAVTFLDSTALGVLVHAANRAGDNCRVVVINPHPIVRRILETTGLFALFTDDQNNPG